MCVCVCVVYIESRAFDFLSTRPLESVGGCLVKWVFVSVYVSVSVYVCVSVGV